MIKSRGNVSIRYVLNVLLFVAIAIYLLFFVAMKKTNGDLRNEVSQSEMTNPTSEIAYIAGGCFWCIESGFQTKEGVIEAVNGYAGGTKETAEYSQVAQGTTKHREAVKVIYDPNIISYKDIVRHFFKQIDPTDEGGQFADRGFHYTTAIYVTNDEQRNIVQSVIDEINTSQKFDTPVATVIEPFTTFFAAEIDHQDYFLKRSAAYKQYEKGSGRKDYKDNTWQDDDIFEKESDTTTNKKNLEGLDELAYKVTQENYTEPAFDNKYRDHKETGIYVDIVDRKPLFSSLDKFDSGTGRPSFTKPIDESMVAAKTDTSYGMVRTEIRSDNADSHLGHVFNDGPNGGERYCINSAALDFVALEDMEEQGYAKYIPLFDPDYKYTPSDKDYDAVSRTQTRMTYQEALDTFGEGGTYIEYEKRQELTKDENNTKNLSDTDIVVLFFHADRCSTCKAFTKNVLENPIPKNLTIVEVDYDTQDDIVKKHNIRSQTSFVQIDSNGEMLERRIGARDLEDLYEKVIIQ